MKRINRVRDLPDEYVIQNDCEECGGGIAFHMPSELKWVVDENGVAHAFCCVKCRKSFIERWSHEKDK